MRKEEQSALHEIDNLVRGTMSALDRKGLNYFSDSFSLIMDFSPYVEHVVLGKLMRSPEHRLLFVVHGSATIDINMDRYQLRRGSLILVPAQSIISMQELSDDYAPITVAFGTPQIDGPNLIGYKVLHLQLSESELKIMHNYFTLLDALIQKGEASFGSVNFLMLSLLVHIQMFSRTNYPERLISNMSKAALVADKFLYILNSEPPVKNIEHYAQRLDVSAAYLRNIIKKQTGRTPSQWINDRTIKEIQLLLTDSKKYYSLEEIAERADCGSASQMIKFFKKHLGITPNTYRKKFQ